MSASTNSRSLAAAPKHCVDSAQILDRQTMLRSVENDLVLLNELAEIFFAESPGLLAQIRAGLAEHNAEAVERSAHTLKGALSNFGAIRACEAARELEIRGRDSRLDDSAAPLALLEAEVAAAMNALSDYLREARREHPSR